MKDIKIEDFKAENLIEELNKKLYTEEFSLKNLVADGVTARHLQYWDENDLLPNKKRKEDENHKFSFVELIWLKLVNELRLFNYPTRKIKLVKAELFVEQTLAEYFKLKTDEEIIDFLFTYFNEKIKNKKVFSESAETKKNVKHIKSKKTSILSIFVLLYIITRTRFNFIILNTGEISIVNENIIEKFDTVKNVLESEPYITIPILKLFTSFVKNETNAQLISTIKVLNESEIRILAILRHGDFDSVKVNFKDNKPSMLELTKNVKLDKEARIAEILVNRNYEKIEIISNGGNLTYAPRTTKIFLK